jgi:prepilin peptidase CpaA
MTIASLVTQFTIISFAGLAFAAALSDIRHFVIPNRMSLAIALLYPSYAMSNPAGVGWPLAMATAAVVLVLGFFLFFFRWIGAGDAKLFAAVALWAGPSLILPLAITTTITGGVIAVYMWLQLRLAQAPVPSMILYGGSDPDIGKHQMPYGAAIAVGALYVAFTLLELS